MNNCIDDNTVVEFIEGVLAAEHAARVEQHTATCAPCRLRLAVAGASRSDLGRASTAPAGVRAPATDRSAMSSVGRFQVKHVLGRGGMGIVFAAYDPKLERNVALKLLHGTSPNPARVAESQARLLAEARALARLSHPNIVTVYEAGTFQGETYIVMELVHGVTLTSWLRRWARPWSSIVDAFVQAGRALAHAHTHGLAHGDFKPDNVLVDDSDRVRVMDFGLARSLAPRSSNAEPRLMMGTPRYMGPEQFTGQPADERSDQFGFCVALYEALFGQHPFAHDTPMSLLKLPAEEAVRPLPQAAREVPKWLLEAVRKGLSADPAERYRSMSELLLALVPPPQPARQRLTSAAVIAALAAVCGLGYALGSYGREATMLAGLHGSSEPGESTLSPGLLSDGTQMVSQPKPAQGNHVDDSQNLAIDPDAPLAPESGSALGVRMRYEQNRFAPEQAPRSSMQMIEFFHDLINEEMRLVRMMSAGLQLLTGEPGELLDRLEHRLDRLEDMQKHNSGLLNHLRQQLREASHVPLASAQAKAQPAAGKAHAVDSNPVARMSGLSENAITGGVHQRWRDIEVCFREWRERQPSGDYTLSVDLHIDSDGTARSTGQDGIADKVVKQCVSGALEHVRFASARTTTEVTVRFVSVGSNVRLQPLTIRWIR